MVMEGCWPAVGVAESARDTVTIVAPMLSSGTVEGAAVAATTPVAPVAVAVAVAAVDVPAAAPDDAMSWRRMTLPAGR